MGERFKKLIQENGRAKQTNCMKAEEARKIADGVKSSEIDEVLKEIRTKSSEGEYMAYFYKNLNDFTVKELKKLGFGYRCSFDRNEILVIISW